MSSSAARLVIEDRLQLVDELRREREADPRLGSMVQAIKCFQHDRFARTYADLLAGASYRQAARFFLRELYGPYDFSSRDHQFARIVPALVRIFPREIVSTVERLTCLHAVSEDLDDRMAKAHPGQIVSASTYGAAWRLVGRAEDRARQLAWTLDVGFALQKYTRRPLLRRTLRAMRGPAHAAGLGALQGFLESGFDTFAQMPDPDRFLDIVARRERRLMDELFAGNDTGLSASPSIAERESAATDGS